MNNVPIVATIQQATKGMRDSLTRLERPADVFIG
jgi:hypothetical protein